uniref:Peptidase A1 domain-containing protein n=1 Tax=Alexandrium monilatum TaxID=311494 RepID=A0A7S4SRV1_9DINO
MTGAVQCVAAASGLPCWSRAVATCVILVLLALPTAQGLLDSVGEEVTPLIVPLRREVVPMYHAGKLVSIKTSYSGVVHVGGPRPQEFRVVFDTGSGHIVLPSTMCEVRACLTKARYNRTESFSGQRINLNGSPSGTPGIGDSVTIGFGKGEVRGDFVRDRICLGPAPGPGEERAADADHCVEAGIVEAFNMSSDPFENFTFDGIIGLGLQGLAVSPRFSFLGNQARQDGRFSSGQFGVFLAEGDDEEESEIAFGGHNPERLLEPLTWVPLAKPELGYWMVQVMGIYVDNVKLSACSDGPCTGILDTGTSHLGLPADYVESLSDMLMRPAEDISDCRQIEAPVVKVELQGYNLTILPENYMRRLPIDRMLLKDTEEANATDEANATAADATAANATGANASAANTTDLSCTAKLMAVKIPALGPNVFLLGEPALHRYYTVYDGKELRAGLGLAARRKRQPEPEEMEVSHDEIFLMQQMRGIRSTKRRVGDKVG